MPKLEKENPQNFQVKTVLYNHNGLSVAYAQETIETMKTILNIAYKPYPNKSIGWRSHGLYTRVFCGR